MTKLCDLLRLYEAEGYQVSIDKSVSFKSATAPYVTFSSTLNCHDWWVKGGDDYLVQVHLLNLGVIKTPNDLLVAGRFISDYGFWRVPTFQEALAFDHEYPYIQKEICIVAYGLCVFGLGPVGLCESYGFHYGSHERSVSGWHEAVRHGVTPKTRFMVVETSDLEQGERVFADTIKGLPEYCRPSE